MRWKAGRRFAGKGESFARAVPVAVFDASRAVRGTLSDQRPRELHDEITTALESNELHNSDGIIWSGLSFWVISCGHTDLRSPWRMLNSGLLRFGCRQVNKHGGYGDRLAKSRMSKGHNIVSVVVGRK
jgi:hypothetical protein